MDLEQLHEELSVELGGEAPPAAAPEAKPDKPEEKEAPEIAQLRRELKDERKARKQAEEGMRHWYDRAAGQRAPEPPKDEPGKEPEIDVVEALTTKGQKFLDEYIERKLAKSGFAKSKDIDEKISSTRAEISREAQLYGKYPDLQDEESEFYQTTLEVYKDLAKDPVMAKAPSLIEAAAKMAARTLGVEPAPARRKAKAEEDDEPEEDERATRVRRQAGGSRIPRQRETAEDPQLERAARTLAEKLSADGATITAEGILKRAQRGVTVSARSVPANYRRNR